MWSSKIDVRYLGCTDFIWLIRSRPRYTLFPYTTLFRSRGSRAPGGPPGAPGAAARGYRRRAAAPRSEEHTSELQSQFHLVCRLLLEKKNKRHNCFPTNFVFFNPAGGETYFSHISPCFTN